MKSVDSDLSDIDELPKSVHVDLGCGVQLNDEVGLSLPELFRPNTRLWPLQMSEHDMFMNTSAHDLFRCIYKPSDA